MRNDRGFTLLEVLVAFVIAALALGLLFKAATGGMLSVRTAGRYEEAVSRAKSHLAAIGRNAELVEGELQGDDGDGYRWQVAVTPVATAAQPAGPAGALSGRNGPPLALYAVTVAVSWTLDGRTREDRLATERLAPARAGGNENE